ncbi:glycoside hydrolase family 65 protein [uncultured Vagococcus sp.]|uniref:glycoside hydrolase family 65 protein n=1 Tax=uncultured Vagococcus sp. TaxID=189676 RepID=UPI0028D6A827|nr:glycoside hydrolase family 65 protein [uncultured Vagococcus sp.]
MFKRLFEIDPWKIKTTQLDVENKRLQESLTSIGNGFMGMRGNFEEGYSGDSHQGTYIAGVWFPDKTRVGWWKNGYPDYFGKVINATNFIGVDVRINGQVIDLGTIKHRDFYLELDMKTGILNRHYTVELKDVDAQIRFERFVSVATQELSLVKVEVEVLKGQGKVELSPNLDGNVTNEDSNYEEVFWLEKNHQLGEFPAVTMETIENPFGTPRFSVTTAMKNVSSTTEVNQEESAKFVSETYTYELNEGQTARLEKYVAVVTSRDVAEADQLSKAEQLTAEAVETGWEALKEAHSAGWLKRWEKADVVIKGDDEAQQGMRFNIFQLFSTYYGEDARLNVGPKGFTGEKYGGATYWDTEAYIVPMYLSVAGKEVSEQLLKYRHQQLPGAFHNAKQQGLKGALYPMVTFTGVECHNEWEITFEEIHRNGAIAHAIFNYTSYTGDETYLIDEGIDVLVGISRFWEDRIHYSERKGQYMIHGVTGPNEYENNVNNNWYTNTIATWVLRYTLESLTKITTEKRAALGITGTETAKWQDIIDKMYFPTDDERGIFVQHDTFLDKDLQPVSSLSKEDLPLNQNWSWDKVLRSPFIKQADVLQGLYFLNHEYTTEEKQRNFDFYEPMTVHESSLSACVHSILAAELGMEEKAVELYARTARLDLDNYNNDTEDGLHITSMSGGWLSLVHGFAGMRTLDGQLSFSPFTPKDWQGYSFKITYQGHLLQVTVDHEEVRLVVLQGEPLAVKLFGEKVIVADEHVVKVK